MQSVLVPSLVLHLREATLDYISMWFLWQMVACKLWILLYDNVMGRHINAVCIQCGVYHK